MTFERFGKTFLDIYGLKQSFIADNTDFVALQNKIADLYRQQPRRPLCKLCVGPLGSADFVKLGVEYSFCGRCGHLNGAHEDTEEFCNALYVQDLSAYSKVYDSKNRKAYDDRVKLIYEPKVEFLEQSLAHAGAALSELRIADYGAGSGYFLSALRKRGHSRAIGFDLDSAHARIALDFLGPGSLELIRAEDSVSTIQRLETEVLCFVSVFEHVRNPRELMRAAIDNPAIRYIMFVGPLVSPALFVELGFDDVYHRMLSGGHTHLFTHSSLEWLASEFGLERIGEWWFGTDMMDFARAILVRLDQKRVSPQLRKLWESMMVEFLDAAQLTIDQKKRASQVHLVFRKI